MKNNGTQRANKNTLFAKACKELMDNWDEYKDVFTNDDYRSEFAKLSAKIGASLKK